MCYISARLIDSLLLSVLALSSASAAEHTLMPSPQTVHVGYFSAALKPVLTVDSGDIVTIESVAGLDKWRARGGKPNQVYRTLFAVAAVFTTGSIFAVAYVKNPIAVVALLSVTLFFLRWCGMYWAIPSILATRDRAGFLGGCMNLGGNIAGITVPIIVGFIVQITGSYFLAMMFFAAASVALLICSSAIDYSRKLPV
jgi:hypothetical protein